MQYTVALAGNPNVGKSTLFNALTGLRQHTGNWTGKTVAPARGSWRDGDRCYEVVDLPGVYSLCGGTPEERIAAEYLQKTPPDCLVIIVDATALERTLALALELQGSGQRPVLCVNLMDEAERLGLHPDLRALERALDAPVVPTRADQPKSVEMLRSVIALTCQRRSTAREQMPPAQTHWTQEETVRGAAALARAVCPQTPRPRRDWDRLLLGKWTAWPLTLGMLFCLFYLTVRGANYPSALLEVLFARLRTGAEALLAGLPEALRMLLLEGVYDTTAKVVSVMLPPMAIFFPLFSVLEDLGLLPRLAFLLDRPFAACGTCGRQGLCMCMGCGCNAVGVTGCRIIPNEKERLAAILTNAMVPCNGRFPTLILLAGLLLNRDGSLSVPATAGVLTGCMLLSCAVTLLSTGLLRKTLLRGASDPFVLELPPFRRPRLARLLLRSLLDRTLRVLGRAIVVAAPAGAVIWTLSRLRVQGAPLLTVLAGDLDPVAALLGFSGTLLLAFLLSFPANELLLPLALLIGGMAAEGGDVTALFVQSGACLRAAFCTALFTLFHWPCSTTLLTVWHETGSLKWTLAAFLLPTAVGVTLCMLANAGFSILS
ncbi:MAG: ferrous iron transporter B [Oscillospiraceae bacterium]|nr:ferrous iron transporter B [Oscillospiraceae bacterium]